MVVIKTVFVFYLLKSLRVKLPNSNVNVFILEVMQFHISLESASSSVMSGSLQPQLYSPWNSPGQNTGVGGRSLLQGIFLMQDSTCNVGDLGPILGFHGSCEESNTT